MKFSIKTKVNQSYDQVFEKFDRKLFDALSPPLIDFEVLQFEGCNKGDKVVVQLRFLGLKMTWKSQVIEDGHQNGEYYFIDAGRGVDLPFFLSRWQHTHLIQKDGENSIVVDEIEYSSGWWLIDVLLFPMLYGQFHWRKEKYRKYFIK